ncbi:MATE family efflux transporter [Chryseolinea lacunae]|uniref:Multidrug-efflux transporter n=1 Tax=Chryseolinea lacunae TaxID=2801331 RepID=A0ABS1KSH4_9BACT|nr:MATE family efflux transporter [Chryseolinea lacunae]MBL0741637.1 MATE family efflux transporter [Chryseolinea lacunae]
MELKLQTGYKQILGMALPISLAIFVPQINFITNNVFLSGLGEKELASAGITGVYYLIFAVIGNGLNNGLQALIARRAGQNLPKEIGRLFFHGVWIALGIAALGIAITYIFAPTILRATIHDPEIATQVINFSMIRIWGLPLLYLYVMRNALLVGTNQTRFLVWGTLAEAVTNIVLDYGFIYGHFGLPALGFNGAAYASIIAEATGLLVIYAVIHIKGIHKSFAFLEQAHFDFSVVKLILVQSSPLILQYAISIMSWEFFYILIEHHGAESLAISNTMRNIFGLSGIFAWAFASTTNTMVSNIIGQGRQDEVMGLIWRIVKISCLFSVVISVALNVWPTFFLSFYGQGDGFIAHAIPVVRIVSVAVIMMGFSTVWLNAVTGSGNTVVNLTIEFITIILYCAYVYVTLEYLNLPITWGWASEWVYWISLFTMSFFYIRSGRWKGKKI